MMDFEAWNAAPRVPANRSGGCIGSTPVFGSASSEDGPPGGGRLPDMHFLEEAVLRGFSAIVARLDKQQDYRPFFDVRIQPTPQMQHGIWDFGDMCARWVEAFIAGRLMLDCPLYRDEQQGLRKLLHEKADPFAHPFMAGRMLLTFFAEYWVEPSPEHLARAKNLVAQIKTKLTFERDYAFWFKREAGWQSMKNPAWGNFEWYPTYPLGGIVLALSLFVEEVDFPEGEDLLDRLARFILDHSGTFDQQGRFLGHTHSGGILTAAAGLVRWAVRRSDHATLLRMKGTLDWCLAHSSSWGWVPDGLGQVDASCETCSLADAIHLGLLLARNVDPSYYDTVERFARNQLMENQIRARKADNPGRGRANAAASASRAGRELGVVLAAQQPRQHVRPPCRRLLPGFGNPRVFPGLGTRDSSKRRHDSRQYGH